MTVGQLEDAMLGKLSDAGFVWGNPAFHGLGLALEVSARHVPTRGLGKLDRDERFETRNGS